MSEINNKPIAGENHATFVDLAGLTRFWDNAKAYIDAVDTALAGRATALETTVNGTPNAEGVLENGLVQNVAALQKAIENLGAADGGIQSMIDATVGKWSTEDTPAEGLRKEIEERDAATLADAKAYTDGVAGNYTEKDDEGTVTKPASGLRKEIEDLQSEIEDVAAAAKSYSVVAVKDEELAKLGSNVKEAYKLVDEDSTQSGDYIKIYKDSSLQSVALNDKQELVFTYLLADGSTSVVPVSVATFLAESEFGDGLQVNSESGVVSVKVDAASEAFLTVGADGVKLSGVQKAIDDAAKTAADNLANAKAEIEAEIGNYTGKNFDGEDAFEEDGTPKVATGLRADLEEAKEEIYAALADNLGNYTEKDTAGNVTKEAEGLRKEIEERDAATLATANGYTDARFKEIDFVTDEEIDAIFATPQE